MLVWGRIYPLQRIELAVLIIFCLLKQVRDYAVANLFSESMGSRSRIPPMLFMPSFFQLLLPPPISLRISKFSKIIVFQSLTFTILYKFHSWGWVRSNFEHHHFFWLSYVEQKQMNKQESKLANIRSKNLYRVLNKQNVQTLGKWRLKKRQ